MDIGTDDEAIGLEGTYPAPVDALIEPERAGDFDMDRALDVRRIRCARTDGRPP